MKLLIAPDSFKGTLSAPQAAEIMETAFRRVLPITDAFRLPLGDGGEGTADCLIACGGNEVCCDSVDGYGRSVTVRYCIWKETAAVIDSASVVPMHADRREPGVASSYGLGLAVRDALMRGCREILLALGGTGSNDGGCGLAAALGVRFLDAAGQEFIPCGDTLDRIVRFDISPALELLDGITVRGLCDVTTPFSGPVGAARVFAPQKGADAVEVERLDRNMAYLAGIVEQETGIKLNEMAGSGAAGGLGGGIAAFLGGSLSSGIGTVLELTGFAERAAEADLILTGEGCTDEQTLLGKAISGVLRGANGTPVVVISGMAKGVSDALVSEGASAVCATNRVAADFDEVRKNAAKTLAEEACNAARLIALGLRLGNEKNGR